MGLSIRLQNERGKAVITVVDEKNLLHKILPASDDARFLVISRIDRYGDTTFNRMQLVDVIREFGQIDTSDFSPNERELLNEVVRLAERGLEKPHMYLRFCGD